MNKTNTPFRYDYVGSFLRPAALKQARADFQSGKIDAAALKAVEDDAIRDLVAKQKAAGYHVITDGEFRRATCTPRFHVGLPRRRPYADQDRTSVSGRGRDA
ncbi:MAG: hypothetical protein ACLSUF_03485 [Oscillospiraceae bacterium]